MNRLTAAAATLLAATTMATGLAACKSSDSAAGPNNPQNSQPTAPADSTSPGADPANTPTDDPANTPTDGPASAPTDDPGSTPTDEPTADPTDNQPVASGAGATPCEDEKYVVNLVRSVREGQQPDDPQAAEKRVAQWLQEIPAEITKPGQAMAYVIVAIHHPGTEAVGGLGTADMNADLGQLDAWSAKNC